MEFAFYVGEEVEKDSGIASYRAWRCLGVGDYGLAKLDSSISSGFHESPFGAIADLCLKLAEREEQELLRMALDTFDGPTLPMAPTKKGEK